MIFSYIWLTKFITIMNCGLIPVSVCKTPYRESEKCGERQLLVATFFLFYDLCVIS